MAQLAQERGVATRIADAIRSTWGRYGRPASDAARALGVSRRTVDAWLEARQAPRAEQLVRLMAESDEAFEAVCQLAGRTPPPALTPAEREAVETALRLLTRGDQ